MESNSIVVTLNKKGFGKSPSFMLRIFEDEKIFYEGFENTKILGKHETNTTRNGFVELLKLVKEIDFFSLKDDYCIIPDEKTPRTEISVSIPVKTGETKTKTVKFFQKDPSIPNSLKILENKIIEISDFNNWDKKSFVLEKKPEIKVKTEPEKKIIQKPAQKLTYKESKKDTIKVEKKPLKIFSIKNKKIISMFFILIIILCFIVIVYQSGFLNFKSTSSSNGKTPDTNNKSLAINTLDTASKVNGLGNYTKKSSFSLNETVFVYVEYSNFSVDVNNNCDLSLEILVKQINGDKSYNKIVYETNSNKIEHHWEIKLDDTWPIGNYYIVVTLTDNISDNLVIENDDFSING